jgi:hypothetical protein
MLVDPPVPLVVVMRRDGFDPGEFDQSLGSIARLWAISLVYVGFNRPIHFGPLALRLTLFALSAPFLLSAVNRLRRSSTAAQIQRPLSAGLLAGVLSYVSGIFWGDVATLVSLGAMVVGVVMFEGAMHRLTADHAAGDLAAQWQRLRRRTAAAGTLVVLGAVVVLAGYTLAWWLVPLLVFPAAALAVYLLICLADATRRTRSWLQSLEVEAPGTVK